jgi:hypothetical protein
MYRRDDAADGEFILKQGGSQENAPSVDQGTTKK